jgi:hypothetical protein
VIHLYGFATGIRTVPQVAGIGDSVVEAQAIEDIAAIVSSIDSDWADHESLVGHGTVLDAFLSCSESVLPARFGERFADLPALRAASSPQIGRLRAQLQRVSGCVELGVRVCDIPMAQDGSDAFDTDRGADYMRAKLAGHLKRERLIQQLHEGLSAVSRDCQLDRASARGMDYRASFLVAEGTVKRFARRVDRYAAAHPEASVLCTGPWPPYSFASTG